MVPRGDTLERGKLGSSGLKKGSEVLVTWVLVLLTLSRLVVSEYERFRVQKVIRSLGS